MLGALPNDRDLGRYWLRNEPKSNRERYLHGILIHRKLDATLKSKRSSDCDLHSAVERIGGDPRLVDCLDVLPARLDCGHYPLPPGGRDSFGIEDDQRHGETSFWLRMLLERVIGGVDFPHSFIGQRLKFGGQARNLVGMIHLRQPAMRRRDFHI